MIAARKRVVTPEHEATGANIEIFEDGLKVCDLSLFNFESAQLATAESRRRLQALRDRLIEKLNA